MPTTKSAPNYIYVFALFAALILIFLTLIDIHKEIALQNKILAEAHSIDLNTIKID